MKKDIHPDYQVTTVKCVCGNEFQTRSTLKEISVEICSACHPFFTGQQKLVDSAGRVERFMRKYGREYGPGETPAEVEAAPEAAPAEPAKEAPPAEPAADAKPAEPAAEAKPADAAAEDKPPTPAAEAEEAGKSDEKPAE